MELISFNSASKGYAAECGLRGGWMELHNINPGVQAQLYKALSAALCPNTLGQVAIDCIAKPPRSGEESFEQWCDETQGIFQSLKLRANLVNETFNCMEGFSCNVVQGAMYAFPRIVLPKKAIRAANRAKQEPDVFYAHKLLEETGICIIPGSGFGQKPGTYHFRTTILPQMKQLRTMLDTFKEFHEKFTKKYR